MNTKILRFAAAMLLLGLLSACADLGLPSFSMQTPDLPTHDMAPGD